MILIFCTVIYLQIITKCFLFPSFIDLQVTITWLLAIFTRDIYFMRKPRKPSVNIYKILSFLILHIYLNYLPMILRCVRLSKTLRKMVVPIRYRKFTMSYTHCSIWFKLSLISKIRLRIYTFRWIKIETDWFWPILRLEGKICRLTRLTSKQPLIEIAEIGSVPNKPEP